MRRVLAVRRGLMAAEQGRAGGRAAVAFLAALVFAVAVMAHFHDRFWYAPDDGAYAHVAERVMNGEVLHRDVQDIHAGFVHFVNAAAFAHFGTDLRSLRLPLAAATVIAAALGFLLLLPRGLAAALAAAGAVTGLTFVQFLNPTAHWYALFVFVALIAVLAWTAPGARGRLETVGFLIVALVLFRQLSGAVAGAAALAFLLAEWRPAAADATPARGRRREETPLVARALIAFLGLGLAAYLWAKTDTVAFVVMGVWPLLLLVWAGWRAEVPDRAAGRMVARLALGGAVAAAPLVVYHAAHGSLGAWVDDAVGAAFALTGLPFMGEASFATLIIEGARQVLAAESAGAVANGLYWIALPLLAPVLGIMVARGLWRAGRAARAFHPLPFLAVFWAVVSAHYQIPIYLHYSAAVTLCGLLFVARRAPARAGAVALAGGLIAVGLGFQAGQPLSRGLDGILAGETREMAPSGLARAALTVGREEAETYRRLVALIRRETGPEEAILALPTNPELYFLSGRRNPVRFFNAAYGIRGPEELARVLEAIGRHPPRLVFYRPGDKYVTDDARAVMARVRARYEMIARTGGFEIYRYSAAAEPERARGRSSPAAPARMPSLTR